MLTESSSLEPLPLLPSEDGAAAVAAVAAVATPFEEAGGGVETDADTQDDREDDSDEDSDSDSSDGADDNGSRTAGTGEADRQGSRAPACLQ